MENITIREVSDQINTNPISNTLNKYPLQIQQDQMCEIHKLFELSIVCVEDTCDDTNSRVGCLKCLRQSHLGHKHILLQSLLDKQHLSINSISDQQEEIAKLEMNVEIWVKKVRNAIQKAKDEITSDNTNKKGNKDDSYLMECQIAEIVKRNINNIGSKTVDKQIKQCIQEVISLRDDNDKMNTKVNQDIEDLREDQIVRSNKETNYNNQALENLKFEMHRLIDQLQMKI